MKKYLYSIVALFALVSCQSLIEEWQPVFTFGDNEPAAMKIYAEDDLYEYDFGGTFTDIQDLKAQYDKKTTAEKSSTSGHVITENIWIKGQVVSDDRTGNLYREIYLQDETAGIDLKLGKSSLYSDFKLGQWVYVKCEDLCIGSYKGMPQLGLEPDNTSLNEYETSYIDSQVLIDTHVFRGEYDTPLSPRMLTAGDISAAIAEGSSAWNPASLWGTYVEVKDLTYGNQIFALVYPHGLIPHKKDNPYNRVFLSDKGTWGINTWAMSKSKYVEYINAGNFDAAEVGSGATRYGAITTKPRDYAEKMGESVINMFGADADITFKEMMVKYATANYVSHYFKVGGTSTILQVRSSGYAKFSDKEIPASVLDGAAVTIKGILTFYDGDAQISLITSPDDPENPSVILQ